MVGEIIHYTLVVQIIVDLEHGVSMSAEMYLLTGKVMSRKLHHHLV